MDVIKKERKPRAKKVEIKISPKYYEFLNYYSKTIDSTPTKIVEDLVRKYLEQEEVKKVLDENAELIKMIGELERLKNDVAELEEKIKEKENSQK